MKCFIEALFMALATFLVSTFALLLVTAIVLGVVSVVLT